MGFVVCKSGEERSGVGGSPQAISKKSRWTEGKGGATRAVRVDGARVGFRVI